jgi:hypothetical protein
MQAIQWSFGERETFIVFHMMRLNKTVLAISYLFMCMFSSFYLEGWHCTTLFNKEYIMLKFDIIKILKIAIESF